MSAIYVYQMYRYDVDSICKYHQICRLFQCWRGWRANIYPIFNQSILPAGIWTLGNSFGDNSEEARVF